MKRNRIESVFLFEHRLLLLLFTMLLAVPREGGAARRGVTDVAMDTGRHRYIIWLDPATEEHPMTVDEQSHYCSAAQSFAQVIWDASNGRHEIENVHFHYDRAQPVGGWDVHWKREIGVQNSDVMFDRMQACRHRWTIVDGTWGPSVTPVLDDEPCPPGTVCDVDGESGRELCLFDGEPFLASPEETGWVLAHEVSHYNYDLWDEEMGTFAFVGDFVVSADFTFCINPEHNVSLMSTLATHWCDRHTHTRTQVVEGNAPESNHRDVRRRGDLGSGSRFSGAAVRLAPGAFQGLLSATGIP